MKCECGHEQYSSTMNVNQDRSTAKLRREHKRLLAFARLLASYSCAGAPACEPVSVDAATGKREGGRCGVCEAGEWLAENGYRETHDGWSPYQGSERR